MTEPFGKIVARPMVVRACGHTLRSSSTIAARVQRFPTPKPSLPRWDKISSEALRRQAGRRGPASKP
jgi:hypothetical protein